MSIAVKSGLPSLGSTEGAVISADEVSVSEDGSAAASVGEDLPRGKSAYEIAKENGFDGTEAEWLLSLKGKPGENGLPGVNGEDGETPYVGDNGNWYIGENDTGKPSRGAKGEPGADGVTPTFGIESVETGEPGTDAEVTMTGDAPNHGLRFVIPRGNKGAKGDIGSPGAKGDKGEPGAKGDKGDKGSPGVTPNLTIGTVTTLDAGQNATASMGGTTANPVLNLGIPRGAKGEPGEGGGGIYYVELEGEFPGYTLSETTPLANIVAAYNDGKALFCRGNFNGEFTIELPLLSAVSSGSIFIFSGSHCVDNTGALPENAMITIAVAESGVYCEHHEYLTGANIVTSVSASSTDAQVPSAKAVYTFVTGKIGEIENGTY